jgi:sugar lactone lactonase YvrE
VVIADGLLFVTERTGKRLQVLTRDGDPVDELAAPCGGWLYGCCVDSTGKVWVSSASTHRVHLLAQTRDLASEGAHTRDHEPDV